MTPRDRRALQIGGAVILAALLLLRLLPAGWRWWRTEQEDLAARRELLARGEQALVALDSLEARAQATRAALVASAPRLVAGGTVAEAQADLNGRLALIANRERTRLLRSDPLPDSLREAQLQRVRLRIEVESDWSGLVGFLQGVVADPAVLRITAVTVRGAEVGQGAGPEVLAGEIEVTGWFLARRPDAEEGGR